ncbi:MAG: DUF2203 domain-containing protein, partial [Terriglobales bacterium]
RFTFDEVCQLLPVLQNLLRQAMAGKKHVETVDAEFQEIARRIYQQGGTRVDLISLAGRKAEREKSLQSVKESLAEIHATGVQVKDLEIGLLDFPCVVGEKEILLCWKLGEPTISHWHGTDEGFLFRKPIDDSIAGSSGNSSQ